MCSSDVKIRVQTALAALDANDMEILVLRHFEELSNAEAAAVLGLRPTAASNRYIRALERLRSILSKGLDHPSEFSP